MYTYVVFAVLLATSWAAPKNRSVEVSLTQHIAAANEKTENLINIMDEMVKTLDQKFITDVIVELSKTYQQEVKSYLTLITRGLECKEDEYRKITQVIPTMLYFFQELRANPGTHSEIHYNGYTNTCRTLIIGAERYDTYIQTHKCSSGIKKEIKAFAKQGADLGSKWTEKLYEEFKKSSSSGTSDGAGSSSKS